MVTTDPANGHQEYVLVTSVISGGGSGDVLQAVTYDGDTLQLTTDLTVFNPIINAGSMHTTSPVTIGGTTYPA